MPKGPPALPDSTCKRATILQEEGGFGEAETYALLDTGVVGDRKEIGALGVPFDDVTFTAKMGRVVRDLENETVFDDV